MARPAPATERTVALLTFLAEHPDQAFGLSDLSRRVGMNKATAHAMVNALVESGWLLRHPADKSYRLGPALIALGHAAQQGFPALDFARQEMRSLSDDLAMECLATAAVDDEIVILDRAGTPQPLGVNVHVGQRLPLVPPIGTVFMAWAAPDEIDHWLTRLGPSATSGDRELYRRALAAVRQRGYAVALEASALGGMLGRGAGAAGEAIDRLAHEEYILLELEHAAAQRINHIAAPVFGADGRVELALALFGFRDQQAAGQLSKLAGRLLQATRLVTQAIHGRETAWAS